MFRRDPCKKGHDWQPFGWSVCGFGPYRYHYKCSRCGHITMIDTPAEEDDTEDGPK